MDLRNPTGNVSGSIAALSLAANPATLITAAVIGGVAVTVSAAVFTYKAWKSYEIKKHREEIEFVNHLHLKHLSRIYISDYNEVKGFPPIFNLTKDQDSDAVESMHLTDEQIDDIGKSLPHSADVILTVYRESIINAILKLKDYYFSRNERDDITAGVISYLLYMLQTKCLNFEGYDYDIAYLKAVTSFITAYASIKERQHSQEFSRLNPVFGYLTTAMQTLQKHKESMSLEEIVGELRDSCIHKSNQMVRCFAKLITPDKYWNLIDLAAIDELSGGVIRREYIKTEIGGLVFSKHHSKKVQPSPFYEWLLGLANYYLKTIDSDTKLNNKELLDPNVQFRLPVKERYLILRNKTNLSRAESSELYAIRGKIKQIVSLYQSAPNFLTTTLDPESINKLPKMIAVTDSEIALDRAEAIKSFATLIHQVISLQHLSTEVLKSSKQLGELYLKNPNHFCQIFFVLESLANRIKDNIGTCRKQLTAILRSDKNTMQLERQEVLPDQFDQIFSTTYATISNLSSQIKDYRNRVAKNLNPDEPTVASVKMEMFEVANSLAAIYGIQRFHHKPVPKVLPQIPKVVNDIVMPQNPKVVNDTVIPPLTSDSKVPEPVICDHDSQDCESKATQSQNDLPLVNQTMEMKQPVAAVIVMQPAHLMLQIDKLKRETEFKFKLLPKNEDTRNLNEFISALGKLRNKANSLLNSSDQTPARQEKVIAMMQLICQLFIKSNEFLLLNRNARIASVQDFINTINITIRQANETRLIDQHACPVTKWFHDISGLSIFATDSRKKLNDFTASAQVIAENYRGKI